MRKASTASRALVELCQAIRRRPYGGAGVAYDNDGTGHLRGGYNLQLAKGNSNPERMAYGYTKQDVEQVQRGLAMAGGLRWDLLHGPTGVDKRGRTKACRCVRCRTIRKALADYCTFELAEQALLEALHGDPAAVFWFPVEGAEKHRELRKKAGAAGRCTRCRRAPARPERTTCEACNERAKAAVRAAREAKAS